MLKALVDAVDEQVAKQYGLHARLEGRPQDGWVLADYIDIVLHIFSPDRRKYYRLEDLWQHGKVLLHLQ